MTKYLIAAASVIVVSMALLTYLISTKVSALVTHYVAQETTASIEADLSKLTQELISSRTLSERSIAQIDAIATKNLGIRAIKIWLRDGTLAYAADRRKIGQRFDNPTLDRAFSGKVVATFDDLSGEENHDERGLKTSLIEVYAPIFATGTRDIIAVGEYYKDASRLSDELRLIQFITAAIVSAVTLPMIFLLYILTRQTDRIATRARIELSEKAEIASALAIHNDELRKAAEAARHDSIRSNELLLQQIGQDIHDGPIQMLSVLALRLSSLPDSGSHNSEMQQSLASATELTRKALNELRDISSGLVLPELETLTAEQTVALAIREHEAISGTRVESSIIGLPKHIARTLKICIFRIVQEGLNNAVRHAGGRGQNVAIRVDGETITITISDHGPSECFETKTSSKRTSLGLTGLKRRVEVLQGMLEFTQSDKGAILRARLPVIRTD